MKLDWANGRFSEGAAPQTTVFELAARTDLNAPAVTEPRLSS